MKFAKNGFAFVSFSLMTAMAGQVLMAQTADPTAPLAIDAPSTVTATTTTTTTVAPAVTPTFPAPTVPIVTEADPSLIDKYGTPTTLPSALPDAPSNPTAESVPPQGSPDATQAAAGEELIYLNATDVDIKDLIKQISKATGTNFLLDDKIRGKITIISEKPMTTDMAYQVFLSSLQVMGYTIVETPGGPFKIVPTKDSITEPLELYKDSTPITDRFITRIIQVQNISANDLSSVIKPLVSKEGNLFAYPQTNSIILTDTGSNIDRMLKIVRELDQEGPQEVIEIIPIRNADAKDITDKILQLFEDDVTGKAGDKAAAAGRARARRGAPGVELEDAPSISKIIADDRTNSIIILGSKRAIVKVRGLIARLDSEITGIEGTIHVYYLKHANAKEMADVLSNLVSGASSKAATTGAGAKGGAAKTAEKAGTVELEGGVKVTADEGTNSLVITASPKDFQTLIEKVVAKLDIPRRQVYLEAVVMEMNVQKTRTLGISGNFGSIFNFAGESMAGFGGLLPLSPQVLASIAGASAPGGGLIGGIISDRTIAIPGTDVEIPAVGAIIQALQTDSDNNVLSTPSILTLDNEEAQIQVGQEIPVKTGETLGASGSTSFGISREDTGVILKITPQISESDTVRLKIEQEISNVLPTDQSLGPTLQKRSVQTVVVANDQQTIVIGGLIDDNNQVTTNKVPYLGDIPVLGNLFKNRNNIKRKTNIIVFITPYIIRDRSDYLSILQKKIEERNQFIDMNYGVSQRKQIRESIKNHASELLEFRGVAAQPGSSVTEKAILTEPVQPRQTGTPPVRSTRPTSSRRSTKTTAPVATTTTEVTTTTAPATTTNTTVTTTTAATETPASSKGEFGPPSRRVRTVQTP